MIELVYVSRAQKRFTTDELKDMLSAFRKNNESLDISGLLLYDGFGTFIQMLEGSAASVKSLYNKISQDDRHSRINLLGDTSISSRSFPDWQMGFRNLHGQPIETLKGYSNFMQQNDKATYLETQPSFAFELLSYFKQTTNSKMDKE